ncbi:SIMPL domain-containing protein [Anaerovibrio sp.]|uniref:SIMPL domain-containing protein n=1 Tax=Anaerovibrio sp. TaxID=1872532 RepID=UPI0038903B91
MLSKKLYTMILCVMMCLGIATLATAAPSEQYAEPSVISVSGYGKVVTSPDVADIRIGIETTAKDAKAAQIENGNKMSSVLTAIKNLGVKDSDIKTAFFDITPIYNYPEGRPAEMVGCTATNYIAVRVDEVVKAGSVIEAALNNGANRIDSLSYDVKEPESLRRSALKNAVRDARNKADILAGALGVRITGIKLVTENVGSVTSRENTRLGKNAMDMVAVNAMVAPLEAGTIDVSATVHIDYIVE